jgi:hypothetical protein
MRRGCAHCYLAAKWQRAHVLRASRARIRIHGMTYLVVTAPLALLALLSILLAFKRIPVRLHWEHRGRIDGKG